MKTVTSYLTPWIALIVLAISQAVWSSGDDLTYKDWTIHQYDDFVHYSTHGTAVHGQSFGFIKRPDNCDKDVIFIQWSSFVAGIDKFTGDTVNIHMQFGKKTLDVGLPMGAPFHPFKSTPLVSIFPLTDKIASPELIRNATASHHVSVKLTGSKAMIKTIDMPDDEFSLNGFIAAQLKAKEMCLSMPSQRIR